MQTQQVSFTIALALIFWIWTLGIQALSFWLSMSLAASVLAMLALFFGGKPFTKEDLHFPSLLLGLGAALALYLMFWAESIVSQWLFPFAPSQISSIYELRTEGQPFTIALVLLFITSPAEEIFWRGFVQKWAMDKYGSYPGWLLASAIYGGVHLFSGNFILIMAALTAGLFWGFLYWQSKNLVPCIISHCLWTVGIFLLAPLA